ncbi:hypothetical protein KAI46_09625, partial [bacterium]|nr:hypothetical protein [bacterium]
MKRLQPGIVICVSLMFLFLILPLNLWAVEYPEESATTATEQEEVVHQDEAMETVQRLLVEGQPSYKSIENAMDLEENYVKEEGLNPGWTGSGKGLYISIGESSFDSKDPSYDRSFITKRGLTSMEAILNAKANIIESVQTSMSALDQAFTPGTDLYEKFKGDIEEAQEMIEDQKREITKLLEIVDQTEADMLRGVTFGDRLNAAMDAAI